MSENCNCRGYFKTTNWDYEIYQITTLFFCPFWGHPIKNIILLFFHYFLMELKKNYSYISFLGYISSYHMLISGIWRNTNILRLGYPQERLLLVKYSHDSQWKQRKWNMHLPWFTNSVLLFVVLELLWASRPWFEVLIDETLRCEGNALFSISQALLLQKSSLEPRFLKRWPWTFWPLDGLSTKITCGGFTQHPRQLLLCYNQVYNHKRWLA